MTNVCRLVHKLPSSRISYTRNDKGHEMSDIFDERAVKEGEYIVENGATVRECAKVFGVGKSTVHSDVTKKLRSIDAGLADEVKRVLDVNLSQRHLRGGDSTKKMYEQKKTRVISTRAGKLSGLS